MSDFKAEMHLTVFTSKRREGRGREGTPRFLPTLTPDPYWGLAPGLRWRPRLPDPLDYGPLNMGGAPIGAGGHDPHFKRQRGHTLEIIHISHIALNLLSRLYTNVNAANIRIRLT